MSFVDKARKAVNDTRFMFFRPKHLSRFEYGAEWQRDQLRSNEAVERMALAMVEDAGFDVRDGWPDVSVLSVGTPAQFKQAWMEDAAVMINALLGDK